MLGTYTTPPFQSYDFVIVGGGSAGCALASRLSSDPSVTVCLLEAGGHGLVLESRIPVACGKLQHTDLTYNDFCEPQPNRACTELIDGKSYWPRGKGLGGSSLVNYMAYVRGNKADYDSWAAAVQDPAWAFDNVLKVFQRMERRDFEHPRQCDAELHGTRGPLVTSIRSPSPECAIKFVEAAKSLGFQEGDYNGRNQEVVGLLQSTTADGARCSAANAYIWPVLNRANLHVVCHATATRVLIENSVAVGVQCKNFTVQAKKEVVLSCSAIGSPLLLQESGIGPKKLLEALGIACLVDSPHVGEHMEDHMALPLFIRPGPACVGNVNKHSAENMPWALPALAEWLTSGTGHLASSAYDATLFYKTSLEQQMPDAQIGLFASPAGLDLFEKNLRTRTDKYLPGPDMFADNGQGFVMVPTLLHPKSSGWVRLARKGTLQPIIQPNYLADSSDLDRLASISKRAYELAMAMKPFSASLVAPTDLRLENGDEFWKTMVRRYASTLYHPCSTCKMGLVVNSRLEVKGCSRLRVADASVFVHNISGNTNAAAIMVGEMCADFIAEKHGLKLGEFKPMSRVESWLNLGLAALFGPSNAQARL